MKYRCALLVVFVWLPLLFIHAEAEVGESLENTEAQAGNRARSASAPSSELRELAEKYNNFKLCDDKIWPGLVSNKRSISVVDLDGSKWRISNGHLSQATDLPETIHFTGGYSINENKTPREVILSLPNLAKQKEMQRQVPEGASNSAPGRSAPRQADGSAPANVPTDSAQCIAAKNLLMSNSRELSQGQRSAPESIAESAFSLGVHETFHVCDQAEKWNYHGDGISRHRSSAYPAIVEPREMRYKTKRALMSALETNNLSERQKFLEEAAYWHKAYKAKYGAGTANAEGHQFTDILEGSAKYVESIAAELDCKRDVSASEFAEISKKAVLARVSKNPEPSYDSESYSLGALAGALLDQKKSPAWKIKLEEQKITALDQLLDSIPAKRGAFSNAESKKMSDIASAPSKMTESCIVTPNFEHLKNYKSEEYVWVSIPTMAFSGAGFFNGDSVMSEVLYVNPSSSASAGSLAAVNQPLVKAVHNPCGQDSLMVLVKRSAIRDGRVNYTNNGNPSGTVRGAVNPTPRNSNLGQVYCGA